MKLRSFKFALMLAPLALSPIVATNVVADEVDQQVVKPLKPSKLKPSQTPTKYEEVRKMNLRTRGYVLTHEHPTVAMAFGGNYAFTGGPNNYRSGIMENGYTASCGGCSALSTTPCTHGEAKGNFTAFSGAMGSDMGNHGALHGPRHDSFSHIRYATDWVREAFQPTQQVFKDTRMRIMVAFAVENEAMCRTLYEANVGGGGPGGDGYACTPGDSIESLERQIEAIKAWAGRNSSWMEIAYSAADARRIVESDKLAIIIGVESDYTFGAENRRFDPVRRLSRLYNNGVRTFYLAHKINSRLSGADAYYPADTQAGKAIRAAQSFAGCFYVDDNVAEFPLMSANGNHNYCDNDSVCGDNHFKARNGACRSSMAEIPEVSMSNYVLRRGGTNFNGFKNYPLPPGFSGSAGSQVRFDAETRTRIEYNNLGLSNDGERVIREAMRKGMIVNIDHVSKVSRGQIRQISAEFNDYPLNALHNNPNAMLVGNSGNHSTPHPHEYDFSADDLQMVKDTNGFFGVRLGPIDAKDNMTPNLSVTANCPQTITENAKVLAYLLDQGLNLGYSLDYTTITQGTHSRTFAGCAPLAGERDYLNKYAGHVTEGLSHIGVMKKFHRELQSIGMDREYLNTLRNDGAEQFLQMWEASEARKKITKKN